MQVAGGGVRMPVRFAKTGMVALLCVLFLMAPWGAEGVDREREAKLKELCTVQGELIGSEDSDGQAWNTSFLNGDWIQESGKSFLPFLSIDASQQPVEQLATFLVRGVSGGLGSKVRGVLQLAMTTTEILFSGRAVYESRYFQAYPGFSLLSIAMEGNYVATRTQRVLCMLGCTVPRPIYSTLNPNLTNHYFWDDKDQGDCSYFLQLHYPSSISLATPAIRGKLRSLDNSFADIKLSSIANAELPYHFDAQKMTAATCNEASVNESVQERNVYKGPFFCSILAEMAQEWVGFSVQQNWPCNVSHSFCSRIGPFSDARDYKSVPEAKLFMRNLRCANETYTEVQGNESGSHTRVVSAVIRLVGSLENDYFAYQTTGCNNGMTLTAEGSWDSKSGVLCMAACRGNESDIQLQTTTREDCDVRICLYMPMALNILRRSTVVGNISSTRQFDANDNSTVPQFFHPLSFFLPLNSQGQGIVWKTNLQYEYTKTGKALALLDRHEPTSNVRSRISSVTSSLFRYPSLGNGYPEYSALRADLLIQTQGNVNGTPLFVEFTLIAINDVLFRSWVPEFLNGSTGAGEESVGQQETDKEYLDELKLLRVAGELKVGTMASISTEGLYNPKSGKMYMIGCRNVKEEWSTLSSIDDLHQGLDCYVEVVIAYPAARLMWIAVPQSVKITISSTRTNVNDPLYKEPITVSTTAITYRTQREGMISEISLEGALSIVTLSFMLVCIFGQWRHMEKNPSSTAFISLLMLGIQAVAFAIPLITGAEALFANKDTSVTGFRGEANVPVLYIGKVLTLTAFLLLAWLFEKVWKARSQASASQEWISVPSEKKVFALWAVVHIVGIVVVIVSHPRTEALEVLTPRAWDGAEDDPDITSGAREWQKEVLEYGGLIQDLFLLPQVFGGFTWKYTGKPLRKLYYVGITVLRLLPHFYARYRKSHLPYPYFNNAEYMYANPSYDFFSRAADIVIPTFSLVLALVVWVQQSCSYAPWARFFSRSAKLKAVSRWTTETELSKRIQRTLSPIPENKPILARGEDSDE